MKNNHKKAFSLIEISIVILIIGVAIVGIAKGTELYQEMKLVTARSITKGSRVGMIRDLGFWLETTSEDSFANPNIKDQDAISSWKNINPRSTQLGMLVQANDAYKPKYYSSGINGLPSVYYDATNDSLRLISSNFPTLSRQSTIFIVINWDKLNTPHYGSFVLSIGDFSNPSLQAGIGGDSIGINYYPYNGVYGNNNINAPLLKNTSNILRYVYDATANQSKIYVNNVEKVTGIASYPGNYNNSTRVVLGNHDSAPRTFGGYFGELIYYNRVLTTQEIADVEKYLSKKWAIKIN